MTGGKEGVFGTETHHTLGKGFCHAGGNSGIFRGLGGVVGKKNAACQGAKDWSGSGIEVDFSARAKRASTCISVSHTEKIKKSGGGSPHVGN